jgi:hypothetical protein
MTPGLCLYILPTHTETRNPLYAHADVHRQMTWSLSPQNDLRTLHGLNSAFNDSIAGITNISGIAWSATLEPLPTVLLRGSARLGGNSLGLKHSPQSKGLVLCDSSFTWTNEGDDSKVRAVGVKLLWNIQKETRRLGTPSERVDLNHADKMQDPIGTYGHSNRLFLQHVNEQALRS